MSVHVVEVEDDKKIHNQADIDYYRRKAPLDWRELPPYEAPTNKQEDDIAF